MKEKRKAAGILLFLMASALAGCRYQDVEMEQTFTISESFDKLVIISKVGDIQIQKGADNATALELTARKFAGGSTRQKAQDYLDQIEVTYAVDNNTCTITVQQPENTRDCVYGGADLVLSGIKDMPVSINLNVGSIHCEEMAGGSIKNNVGDITVSAASGEIDLETDTGTIDIADYSGSAFSLRTAVGDAEITINDNGTLDGSIQTGVGSIGCSISKNSSTAAQLKTGVGKIEISGITDYSVTGFISLEGSFELGAAEGDLVMETGTGDISVEVF